MTTPLRNFRMDEDEWQEFLQLCKENDETASAAIRRLIKAELSGSVTEDDDEWSD